MRVSNQNKILTQRLEGDELMQDISPSSTKEPKVQSKDKVLDATLFR